MKTPFALFFLTGILAVQAAAQVKPDFSGTWIFDKTRSKLELEHLSKMDRGVAVIQHKEPHFKFSRTFTIAGKDDSIAFEFTTDGKEKAEEEDGRKMISTVHWEGESLVFITRFIIPGGEAVNTVLYTLLEGGNILQADEKFRGPKLKYHHLWIFEKQP
jgi:hypothetical protein